MSDIQNYIAKRKAQDPEFALEFNSGYEEFKIGAMLKQARERAGMTQDQLAAKLDMKTSNISRIENHAEDIKLSTLDKFARAIGKQIHVEVS